MFINYKNKRKQKRFSDKKVANEFAKSFEAKIKWAEANGNPVVLYQQDTAVPTLKEYADNLLKTYVESNCKLSTASEYRRVCRGHLYPTLGHQRLDEITRGSIKQLVATWNGLGLKKRTILNILTPWRELYNHAIDDGVVAANPVAKVGMIVRAVRSRVSTSIRLRPTKLKHSCRFKGQ